MIRFFKYYLLIASSIYLLFYYLLPRVTQINQIIEIFLILPFLFFIFIPKIQKFGTSNHHNLNLGLIYFVAMALIMIIGNLNNFIVMFIYPTYGKNISITNYYWMGGMMFLAFGFLHSAKIIRNNYLLKVR